MSRLLKLLDRAEDTVMVAGLASATLLVVIQVILRYVFNSSIFWAEELVRYIVVWMAFIGAAMGVRRGKHISVDLLQAFLPERAARGLALAAALVGALFALILVWYGLSLTRHALGMGQLSSAMRVPMGWVYMILPLCGALLFIRFTQVGWELWTGRRTARIDIDHLAREAGMEPDA